MLHHPFQDSFWSPNAALDAVPNFSYGLDVLHGKLHQSMEENTVIVQYLRQRIAAEHGYAELLQALSFDNIETAFEKDVGAGLKRSFEIVRSESGETANGHLTRANNLTETALDPLERLAMRYQRIVQNTKTTMDKRIKDFEIMAESVDQVRTTYKVKCRAVQALDLEYLPPLPYVDMQVRLGKFTFAYMEIIRLLQRMSQDYNQQPKQETTLQEDHDIVVLTGEFIYEWMHNYCHLLLQNENNNHDTDFPSSFTLKNERERNTQMTMEICQDLLAYSFLCSVSGGQSTFDSLPDVFYKIRKQTFKELADNVIGNINQNKVSVEDEVMTASSGLGGIFERWNHKNHEENKQLAIQDMQEADKAYKESVAKAEKMRMETEQLLFMHYEEMESLEFERIQTIKQAFISIAAALSNTIPLCKEMYDRMMLYQETLRPDKDVRFIVEQYRTGRYCPKPIIYESYFHGTVSGQAYGIALDQLAQIHHTMVPFIISEGLAVIESGFKGLCYQEKEKAWTTQLPLDRIHTARDEINYLPITMKEDFLQRYDILLLASLIRLFLMELPECLLTFELYEPFKLLYTNSQDDESRLVSISKLLATLPATNFYTIKTLVNHFHKLFEDSGDVHSSELLENIASIFGHIIIRSQIESNLKIHDKHPQRLMRDLIKHYHSVFSVETHKAQGEHASRRSIVANFETASKEPSLKSPSFSSTSSAISTLASDTGLTATSATSATSQEVSNKDVKPSVSVPARRRTLLSFMRRGTLEQSQNSGVLGKGGLKTSTSTPRKPIHVPSASMLFEDPEETSNDHVSPTHTFFNPDTGKEEHTFLCQHISQSRQISTSNIDLAKNSHTTLSNHTRHDSIESTNNIDQGSMSSFFDDEDF